MQIVNTFLITDRLIDALVRLRTAAVRAIDTDPNLPISDDALDDLVEAIHLADEVLQGAPEKGHPE